MSELIRTIKILRRHIPDVECVPGCHDCCGPVLATVAEIHRMPQISGPIRENALAEFNCVHLGKCGCQIYEDRPLICRLFGTTAKLACPRGIKPEKAASQRVERMVFRILSNNELRLI